MSSIIALGTWTVENDKLSRLELTFLRGRFRGVCCYLIVNQIATACFFAWLLGLGMTVYVCQGAMVGSEGRGCFVSECDSVIVKRQVLNEMGCP